MASQDDPVSYAADVKPLFRQSDRRSMMSHFDLWSYDDVRDHASAILTVVEEGRMPCDGPWPADRVDVLRRWVAQATPI
jgi:hypothetical protein